MDALKSVAPMRAQNLREEYYGLFADCPENHYFGAHPGDGSDFGVWENESEFNPAQFDADLAEGDE